MQDALSSAKHTASLAAMQAAYIPAVVSPRNYRIWRRLRLIELLDEVGGPKELATIARSTDTHLIACSKGRRGIGDDLAEQLEIATRRPIGWMDTDPAGEPQKATPPPPAATIDRLGQLIASAPKDNLDELAETMRVFVRSRGAERHHAAILDLLAGRPPGDSIGKPPMRDAA